MPGCLTHLGNSRQGPTRVAVSTGAVSSFSLSLGDGSTETEIPSERTVIPQKVNHSYL